jgi:RNA polymerase sigma-70 factor, ECF subfamily
MELLPQDDPERGFEFRASQRGRLLLGENSWLRRRARRKAAKGQMEVSDLVQDVRLRALGQAEGAWFPNRRVFRLWLDRILGNRIGEILRRRRPEACDAEVFEHVAGSGPSPVEQAAATERDQRLKDLLEALPDRQRRVLELRLWEKLPYAEIGARLGISPGNARVLWHRGLDQVRGRIGKDL